MSRLRTLTFDERCRWGKCVICGAADGQWCSADVIPIGYKLDGSRLRTGEGAHAARLKAAPARVREVAA